MNPLRTFLTTFWILFLLFVIGLVINIPYFDQRYVVFAKGADFLADFINNVKYSEDLNPYINSIEHIYPPLAYVLLYPVSVLSSKVCITMPLFGMPRNDTITSVAIIFSVTSALIFIMLLRKFMHHNRFLLTIILCCSGVMIFSIERANLVWISVIGSTIFLLNERSPSARSRFIALIGISIAAAFKIYPAIFCVLWLNKKDLKWFLGASAATAFLGLAPLSVLENDPISNSMQLLANALGQNKFYFDCCFIHSPTLPAYLAGFMRQLHLPFDGIVTLSCWTFKLLGLICLTLSPFCREKWQKMFLLTSTLVFLPSITMHYTALYFLPAIVCFLDEAALDKPCVRDSIIAILFAILLSPLQFFIPTIICPDGAHSFSITPFICGIIITTVSLYIVGLNFFNVIRPLLSKIILTQSPTRPDENTCQ